VILALNTGSSSVRFAAFDGKAPLWRKRRDRRPGEAVPVEELRALGDPEMVVHRVVHGGTRFARPIEVDAAAEAAIEELAALAPLHQPVALEWIRGARQAFPRARQLAVFDTAFFTSLPEVATAVALPVELGMRRYGFHGLAHQAMWRQLGRERGRAVTLQLGSGCSAAAILDGRPIETSMGMTPLEGLVMATRPGDLDPGIVLSLGPGADELLNQRSGLLGLSGESGDVRVLLASSSPRARLALEVYTRRIRKYIGAYLALLGGADCLVFGGGVGENAPTIRAAALSGLAPLGIVLDEEKNRAAVGERARIDGGGSVEIWVLPSDEEQQMVDAVLHEMEKP
jgi:acetate kinase